MDAGGADALLVSELHGRQRLLEHLSRLQRAIVERQPLHHVLEGVVDGADELIGADATGLRLRDADDNDHTVLVACRGAEGELLAKHRRAPAESGIGGAPLRDGELIRFDAASRGDIGLEQARGELVADLAAPGLVVGMAAPLHEGADAVGALIVGSRDSARTFTQRDEQVLLALAGQAGLALGHAQAVEAASQEALRDSLTGMPNRALFVDRLTVALTRAERTAVPVAVLFCDLDGFKTVNDSLGHQAGDRLLVMVAERLRQCLRPEDTLARLGGDEFAVLLDALDSSEDAARTAQRMLDALEQPFELHGREIYIGASVGIAAGTGEAHTLLRDADLAMYRAKGERKGTYATYEPHLHTAALDRLDLELDLRRAVERGEFALDYQPIFELGEGRIVGLEALVRWHHPRRGLIGPSRFVPLAEESGEIIALGSWVLSAACKQASRWRARRSALAEIGVSVNISAVQLRQPDFPAVVSVALAAADLDPGALTLEITESALMKDTEIAVHRLHELKELGTGLAIDDFGTGYSSLAQLRRFPLDQLKIDRDFVAADAATEEEPALLQAVVDLAEIFALVPVAEGIERREELERLLDVDCPLGQGHLLSRPLTIEEADAFLDQPAPISVAI